MYYKAHVEHILTNSI